MRTPDFGAVAAVYDEVRPLDDNRRELFELLIREADLDGCRLLDVGCGTGQLVAALTGRGIEAVGVDSAPEMVEVARSKLPGPRFAVAPAERLPFAAGRFDRVALVCAVHLVDRPGAFAEARRVLAPGGRIAVVTFERVHFDRYYLDRYFPSVAELDRRRFPDERTLLDELAAAGFRDSRVVRLHQETATDREVVLQRVRARHISTLQLLPEEEYTAGLEQLERELPAVVRGTADFLIVVSAR